MTKEEFDKKLATAINEDFKELLVKEFTFDWKIQREIISMYLRVMHFDNTYEFINKTYDKELKKEKNSNSILRQELKIYQDKLEEERNKNKTAIEYIKNTQFMGFRNGKSIISEFLNELLEILGDEKK